MSKLVVPWSRVFNIDETAVRYVPLPEYGWQLRGGKSAPHSVRGFITTTLCCSADPGVPLVHQVIHEGRTTRVVPSRTIHWATQDTVNELLEYIPRVSGQAEHHRLAGHGAHSLCSRVVRQSQDQHARSTPDFRSTWLHGLVSAAQHCIHAFIQSPPQLGRDSRLRLRDCARPGLAGENPQEAGTQDPAEFLHCLGGGMHA